MDLMEQLLCPQVCMDVEDTPLEIEAPAEEPGESPEAELNTLPIELRTRMILDNEFSFVDAQVPLPLLPNEADVVNELFSQVEFLKDAKLHCTTCNRHIGTSLVEQLGRFIHPELNVLMCQKCFKFYGTGEFEKDEDGSELYCKWCGQGGTVMCCSDCPLVFCQSCVKRNLGVACLNRIKNSDNWKCFKCNPEQLRKFHITSHVLHEYTLKQLKAAIATRNMFLVKDDFSTCCKKRKRAKDSDDENDEFRPVKIPKQRAKPKATTPASNDAAKIPSSGFLHRALSTLNAGPPNTPDTLFQSLKLQSAVTAPGTNQPVLKFRIAPIGQPTQDPNLPTLAELMPTIFNSMVPSVNAANSLQPVRHHYSKKSTTQAVQAKSPMKTTWLTNSIAMARVQAQALIREVDEVQKLTRGVQSYTELANIHNQLQRAMASCTNRLIASRRLMYKDFLKFLKVNNIAHSSVPSSKSIATSAASSRPVKKRYVAKKAAPKDILGNRGGVVAEIDLCDDDDDDDAMVTEFGTNSNSLDDPLAISDDQEDYDQTLSSTRILKSALLFNEENGLVLDLTDDTAAPVESESSEQDTRNAADADAEHDAASNFDFVREMQNEISLKLAAVPSVAIAQSDDIPSPSTVSASLIHELAPAAKKDAETAPAPGLDALEAIKQLTETIVETITESQLQAEQDIDSNDNVTSQSQDGRKSLDEVPVENQSESESVVPVPVSVPVPVPQEDIGSAPSEVAEAAAEGAGVNGTVTETETETATKTETETATETTTETTNETTTETATATAEVLPILNVKSHALSLEDMVKLYESRDGPAIDADMVPAD